MENSSDNEICSLLQESLLEGTTEKIQQILCSHTDNYRKCKEIFETSLDLKIVVNLTESKRPTMLYFVARTLDQETYKYVINRISKDSNIFGDEMDFKQLPLDTFFKPYNLATNKEIIPFSLDDISRRTSLFTSCVYPNQIDIFRFEINVKKWEIVKLLCAHGAAICLKNEIGINLLHYFCKMGCLDDVRFVVKYGADIFSKEPYDGGNAFRSAVFGRNLDIFDFLIQNGLDINATDDYGAAPLLGISMFLDHNVFFFLCKKCPGKFEKECVNMIEFLVDNGADVNDSHENFYKPLYKSIAMNLLEVTECLLELKATKFLEDPILISLAFKIYQNIKINSPRIDTLELLTAFVAMKKDYCISKCISEIHDRTKFAWIEPFFVKCKSQVNEMKRRNICQERNISIFDILSKNLMDVATYYRIDELMLVLESGEYMKEFPSYGYLLGKRIERVQLLRNSINLFSYFLEKFYNKNLPIVVFDIILGFLRVSDLRNFARALKISKDFPNGKYCIA